jgi:hypothetical protein
VLDELRIASTAVGLAEEAESRAYRHAADELERLHKENAVSASAINKQIEVNRALREKLEKARAALVQLANPEAWQDEPCLDAGVHPVWRLDGDPDEIASEALRSIEEGGGGANLID